MMKKMEILVLIGFLLFIFSRSSSLVKPKIFTPNKSTLEFIRNSYGFLITQNLELWNIQDVDPLLIVSQIYVESHGDTNAKGDGGNSYGLMQIQKNAIQDVIEYGENNGFELYSSSLDNVVANVYDTYVNIHYGIGYLAYLMVTYSVDINTAFLKYNTGSEYFSKILACRKLL